MRVYRGKVGEWRCACLQSITALAHLRAAVLYVLDISEQCGHSLAQQAALFHSIKPLFANKPLLVVANKVDATRLDSLAPADKAVIDEMVSEAARMSGVLPAHLSRRAGPSAWTQAIVCRSHTGSGKSVACKLERWTGRCQMAAAEQPLYKEEGWGGIPQ